MPWEAGTCELRLRCQKFILIPNQPHLEAVRASAASPIGHIFPETEEHPRPVSLRLFEQKLIDSLGLRFPCLSAYACDLCNAL